MRRALAVPAFLLAAAPLAWPSPIPVDTSALLRAFAARDREDDRNLRLTYPAQRALVPLARESTNVDLVLARYGETLGLAPDAAGPLFRAVLLEDALWGRQCECPREYERVVQDLGRAWAAAPDAEIVVDAVGWVFGMSNARIPEAAERLAALTPPGARRARMALALGRRTHQEPAKRLMWSALSEEPGSVALLSTLARTHQFSVLGLPLREAAARVVLSREGPVDPELVHAVGSEWVAALLKAGLAREALAACAQLPDAVCRQLREAREQALVVLVDDGLPFEVWLRDLSRPLVAARLLTGDAAGAAEWWDEAAPAEASAVLAARGQVIEVALGSPDTDAFDLFLEIAESPGWLTVLDNPVWTRLGCGVARRQGLDELARMLGGRSRQLLTRGPPKEAPSHVSPELVRRTHAFGQALRETGDGLEAECGAEPEDPPPSPSPARRLLRAYLDSPPEPFTALGGRGAVARQGADQEWPPGFTAQRLLRRESHIVALGSSGRWRVGAPPSGLWLLRPRNDAGAPPPLYLGLPRSRLAPDCPPPALSGDRLTVAVVEPRDELTGRQLPWGQARPPCRPHQIPLADLESDQDGDGLTDVAEETLFFTDPSDPDTDGDGRLDGTDSLPQVPRATGPEGRRAGALAAFFACVLGPPDGSEVDLAQYAAGLCRIAQLHPRAAAEPLYFVGHRSELTSLETRTHVIAWEPDEYREFRQRRPVHGDGALRITVLQLNEDETHAYLVWASGEMAGEVELTWRDGEWHLRELSITT